MKQEFYNTKSQISLENKIINMLGEVCFYNGSKREGEVVGNNKEFNIRHIKFVDPNNEEQVIAFYERQILVMKRLQRIRSQQAPFRNTIKESYRKPY